MRNKLIVVNLSWHFPILFLHFLNMPQERLNLSILRKQCLSWAVLQTDLLIGYVNCLCSSAVLHNASSGNREVELAC